MQPLRQVARQQVRHREQSPLVGIDGIHGVNGLVDLAVVGVRGVVLPVALDEHPHEGGEEVPVRRGGR